MRAKFPWDIHTDLTADRLKEVAKLLRAGSNDALDNHNPDIGDNAWTLGVRAYNCGRHQIEQAAVAQSLQSELDETIPWLGIVDGGPQFAFRVGTVPARFYRGEADEPTDRTLKCSFPEIRQQQLSLEGEAEGCLIRFAVERDVDGNVNRVSFVALRGEVPVFSWEIPLEETQATVYEVKKLLAEGVILDAPIVKVPGDKRPDVDTAESA